jgi:hypothetical protein
VDSLTITITGRLDDPDEVKYSLKRFARLVSSLEGPDVLAILDGHHLYDSNGTTIGLVSARPALMPEDVREMLDEADEAMGSADDNDAQVIRSLESLTAHVRGLYEVQS